MAQLTEFQRRILKFLQTKQARREIMSDTFRIAQQAFPEKWAKRSGRGALTGHIDRAASSIPGVVRHAARDEHCKPQFSLAWGKPAPSMADALKADQMQAFGKLGNPPAGAYDKLLQGKGCGCGNCPPG